MSEEILNDLHFKQDQIIKKQAFQDDLLLM